MQISKKMFPYPIINREKDYSTYVSSTFNLKVDEEDTEKILYLKNVHYYTDSLVLTKLINDGLASVCLIIECSDMIYKKQYQIFSDKTIDIELNKADFNGKVVYSLYAYATQNFTLHSSNEFLEDYRNIDYDLEKYSILAGDDGKTVVFNHEESEDNVISSIFTIIPKVDCQDKWFTVDYDTDKKIIITLNQADFNNYKEMFNIANYKEVFFSFLLVPSLTEALMRCKDYLNEFEIDEIIDRYSWFGAVTAAYKKQNNKELTKEILKDLSPVVLAQQLLGQPISISLKTLLNSLQSEGEDDE